MKKRNKPLHLRADLLLIAGLLAASLAAYALMQLFVKKEGVYAVVKVDGRIVHQLTLKETAQLSVAGYQGGSNMIVVDGSSVYMKEADCPDKICVHTGKISRTGETIVCLPHRIVIEITGGTEALDSVVR